MLASFGPVGPPSAEDAGADKLRAEGTVDAPHGAESSGFAALVQALAQHLPGPRRDGTAAVAAPGDGAPAAPAPRAEASWGGKFLPLGGTFVQRTPTNDVPGAGAASGATAALAAAAAGLPDERAAALSAMLTARPGPAAAEGDLASRPLVGPRPPAEAGDAAAQPFARPAAPAAEPVPPLPIPSSGGQRAGFDQAFGERILWLARNGTTHAEIRVRPEHLGPIEARLSLDGDRVQLQLSASSALTREVLEQALPRLRGMFEEAGLQLGDAGVGQGRDGEAAGDADPRHAGAGGETGSGGPGHGAPGGDEPGAIGESAPSSNRHLLDVFV